MSHPIRYLRTRTEAAAVERARQAQDELDARWKDIADRREAAAYQKARNEAELLLQERVAAVRGEAERTLTERDSQHQGKLAESLGKLDAALKAKFAQQVDQLAQQRSFQ